MCGILAGSLYRLNVFYIRKAKVNLSLKFEFFFLILDFSNYVSVQVASNMFSFYCGCKLSLKENMYINILCQV